MRILLDTNVLISAFVARGVCSELIEHCAEQHTLVTSLAIIDETREKLLTKFRLPESAASRTVDLLFRNMEIADQAPLSEPVSRDPDDDAVLASATGGDCLLIVTGDRDLLDLRTYRGIAILSPREFRDAFGPPGIADSSSSSH